MGGISRRSWRGRDSELRFRGFWNGSLEFEFGVDGWDAMIHIGFSQTFYTLEFVRLALK